jgi:hypothetical protein
MSTMSSDNDPKFEIVPDSPYSRDAEKKVKDESNDRTDDQDDEED